MDIAKKLQAQGKVKFIGFSTHGSTDTIIQTINTNQFYGEEWVKTWHHNLPTFDKTPGQINIPVILWLWNVARAYDLVDYAKMRYNLLGNGSHWFPGNKADKLNNLDLQQCLSRSPHAGKIPTLLTQAHQMLDGQAVQRLSH